MTLADTTNTIAQKTETVTKVVADVVEDQKTCEVFSVVENAAPEADSTTTDEVHASASVSFKTLIEANAETNETSVEIVAETKETSVAAIVEDATSTVESTTETKMTAEASTDNVKATQLEVTVVDENDDTNVLMVVSETVEKVSEGTPMEAELVENSSPEESNKKLSEHLSAGRRFMKTNSFDKAAESLSLAAVIAAKLFGEGHEDTFEANFLYGKALLELAKIEDAVLTNALTDIPKSADGEDELQDDVVENPENVPQEERAEIKHQVEEALGVVSEEPEIVAEETFDAEMEKTADESEEKPEETVEVKEGHEQATENEAIAEVAGDVEMENAEEQEAVQETEEESDPEDDDEPMKLAWEILETSRMTCEKKLKSLEAKESIDSEVFKSWKLNHADVLTTLGEHGMADNKNEQARKDLKEALAIQVVHLPSASRILANTTHLLAKAFSLDGLFEKAASHFCDAKNILIAKEAELKKLLETATEDVKNEIESEIKELKEVVPELDSLILDARGSAKQTENIKEYAEKELEVMTAKISKIGGEEAKDITEMVRRPTKRPALDEPVEDIKKRKSEDGAETFPDEKNMDTSGEFVSGPAPVPEASE